MSSSTVAKAREINVMPDSELARVIDAAEASPLILVKDGVRYRLARVPAEEAENDEAFTDADESDDAILDKIIGAWGDVDADAMIEMLRRAREEGSRPMDHPPVLR